jgi:GxxExxY protein
MPVLCPIKFKTLTDEKFRSLDYQVMRHVFASHNEMGRLCDEDIYQADLAVRLQAAGLGPVHTEVPIDVNWRTFSKRYYLDLVVQDSHLYELKCAQALLGENKTQTLNYVMLLGLRTGKLVNFRPAQVESWFASSRLTLEDRRRVTAHTTEWRELTPSCADFQASFVDMLAELGAFLDLALYESLLADYLGGENKAVQRVELFRHGFKLGSQRCHLLTPDVGFRLTAHTGDAAQARSHLERWVAHTSLRAVQWVNLNRTNIEFVTLPRP